MARLAAVVALLFALFGIRSALAQPIRELCGHDAPVYAVAFDPDGRRLATGSFDQSIRLWDPESGETLRTLAGHDAKVLALTFSGDGQFLASADAAGTIYLWDLDRQTSRRFVGHEKCVYALAFSPDGTRLFSCGHDRTIRTWDVQTGQQLRSWENQATAQYAVAVHGNLVAHGGLDGNIHLVDRESGQRIGCLEGPREAVYCLTFSPDGDLIAGHGDRSVRIWEVQSQKEKGCLMGHLAPVYQATCTADSRRLISIGTDGQVVIWDLATGTALHAHRFPGKALCAALSADGRCLAIGTGQSACYLVELPRHLR